MGYSKLARAAVEATSTLCRLTLAENGLFSVSFPFCRVALASKSALVSPRLRLPPRSASSRMENCTVAPSESQCTGFSGVRDVAGTVNSKSSATRVPARVGEEKLPPAAPLKVALPSTRKGRSVGPPSALTRGLHSSRFEVETERCSLEDAASVPVPAIFESGVDSENCPSSRESLLPRYLP